MSSDTRSSAVSINIRGQTRAGRTVALRGPDGQEFTAVLRGSTVTMPDDADPQTVDAARFTFLCRVITENLELTFVAGGTREHFAPESAVATMRELLRRTSGFRDDSEWPLKDDESVRLAVRFCSGTWTELQIRAWGLLPQVARDVSYGVARPENPNLPRVALSVAALPLLETRKVTTLQVHPLPSLHDHALTVGFDDGRTALLAGVDHIELLAGSPWPDEPRLLVPQDAELTRLDFGRIAEFDSLPLTTYDLRTDLKRRLRSVGGEW